MFSFGYEDIEEALTWNTSKASGMSPEDAQRAAQLLALWMRNQTEELVEDIEEKDVYITLNAAFKSSSWRPISLYNEFSNLSSFIDTYISELKQAD